MNQEREITREELYKLVWSKSLVLAAQELGISDVGLAKICKRLNVPRPYRGYWARLESGHKPRIPTLPRPKQNTPASAYISPTLKRQPTLDETHAAEIKTERLPANRIIVAEDLRGAHPIVRQTKKRLDRKVVGPFGRMYPGWFSDDGEGQILDINVSPGALDRTLRIMDALIKAIEIRGGEIESRDRKTFCRLNDAEVRFSLWEKVTRSERELDENECLKSYVVDRWIFTPTGQLTFRIDEYYFGRKTWKDKKTRPLEEQLNDVMIGLITAARIIREEDLRRERERQRELEEQQRRVELARIQQIENERRSKLNRMAESWIQSINIKQFLLECEKTLSKEGAISAESLEARWLSWARSYADELDPFNGDQLNRSLHTKFSFEDRSVH